jgi:hypothetical protein
MHASTRCDGVLSAMAILQQLRRCSVVQGNRSCRFSSLSAKGTRPISLRSIRSRFGYNKLRVEAEGHLNAAL